MNASPARRRLRFGVFEVDPSSGDLWKHGLHIKLHDKPFQVLQALLEHTGELVTRKELQERLWPGDTFVEFENGLNNAISRLRETLGDSADSPRFIETVPRRGYRFIAPVEPVGELGGEMRTGPPRAAQVPATAVRRRLFIALGLAGAIILSVFLYRTLNAPSHPIDSVAVLPFVTAGATEGSPDEVVAFGMTEALIAELSRVGALKVISQTSALQYKGTRKPLPVIARELGVGAVVEGSVVREGQQVRITVQLIDARSDTHLWAETFRHDGESVLALQGDLAQTIAREIGVRLTGQAEVPRHASRAVDPRAHEAYLKGRYFLRRRGEEAMGRARDYFEQAIAADPNHAGAYAGLADYYILTDSMPSAAAFPKARTYALKAVELHEDLADAHVSLAYVHYYGDWNWREAEREFQRAIQLDPSHSQARYWYGRFLGTMGRHQEASDQMQRALVLDPLTTTVHDAAAMQWFYSHQFDKMIEQANKILELDSRDYRAYEHLAVAYLFTKRFEQAHSAAQQGLALLPREPLFIMLLAIAQDRLGRTRESAEMLGELERMSRESYVPHVFQAVAYSQLGKKEQALKWLQVGYRNRDPYMVMLKVLPWFDPIRSDALFQDLLRRMNFPQGQGVQSRGLP